MDQLSDDARDLIARAKAAVQAPPPGEQAEVWTTLSQNLDAGASPKTGASRPLIGAASAAIVAAVVLALAMPGGDDGPSQNPTIAADQTRDDTPDDEQPSPTAATPDPVFVPPIAAPPEDETNDHPPTIADDATDPAIARPRRAASSKPRRAKAEPEAAAAETDDTLLAEMQLLERAQAALRRNDPKAALQHLAEHASRFPRGVLTAERMAAQVLAHCDAGHPDRARELADRFLHRHRDSPLAQRVRSTPCVAKPPDSPDPLE